MWKTEKFKYCFKLLVIGDSETGKSNIIYRILKNEYKELAYITMGIKSDYMSMKVGKDLISLALFDVSGKEWFRSLSKAYYNKVHGIILVYDITSRKSFEGMDYWMTDFKNNNLINKALICLVGNKSDLDRERVITYEEGRKFAEKNCFCFCEVSARTGKRIEEMINNVIEECIEKYKYEQKKRDMDEIEDNKLVPLIPVGGENTNQQKKKC